MLELLLKYFPQLSETQQHQFVEMSRLYPDWNEKINVISRKDIDNLWVNHILHSLAIAAFLRSYHSPAPGTTMIDLGCGGGFPGIPLAVVFPECKFHLIDRIGKKVMVAKSIAEAIGLTNCTFQHGDMGECHKLVDYVVSRAVMPLSDLVKACRKNIAPVSPNPLENGLICLKGGNLDDELKAFNGCYIEQQVGEFFSEPRYTEKDIIYVPLKAKKSAK
ncbi:MAG: 16S rRNA (guanine(527)-N(7))-methyltransferase RsmG [Bacteroidales bacterium]|nr:16S rRNA (guanine(527)-N(7))-methyltransferase RsmG [Bacteroidales bacterium]